MPKVPSVGYPLAAFGSFTPAKVPPTDSFFRQRDYYAATRYDPDHYHVGCDLPAPAGTPVKAITAGIVRRAGRYGALGLIVTVEDFLGREWWYAHLSAFEAVVGAKVQKGKRIGAVGSTGTTSSGPHLHVALMERRQAGAWGSVPYGNPYPWLALAWEHDWRGRG